MAQIDYQKRKRIMERRKIKTLIREAKQTVKKMKPSEPVSSFAYHTLIEGNIVLGLERQRVMIAVDKRMRRR